MNEYLNAEKYAYCNIKNIAVPNIKKLTDSPSHIDLISVLPDDCIRIRINGWCNIYCKECYE